jgi:5-methylcytosine-specific restriction endonuclease McrA
MPAHRCRRHKARFSAPVRKARDPEEKDYLRALLIDPCSYCGAPATSIDHIVPSHLEGDDHWENYTAICGSCNSQKGTATLLGCLAWFRERASQAAIAAWLAHEQRYRQIGVPA